MESARIDGALQACASELADTGALAYHCGLVEKELAKPQFTSLLVADLYPFLGGSFSLYSRELVLDREEAADALRDPCKSLSASLLHELVHAAQREQVRPLEDFGSGLRELHLLEGATDAMAAQIRDRHEPVVHASVPEDKRPPGSYIRTSERNGPAYGPYEATTRALLSAVSAENNWHFAIKDYAVLGYGARCGWLRDNLVARRRLWAGWRFGSYLDEWLSWIPSDEGLVPRAQALWDLESRVADALAAKNLRTLPATTRP